MPTFGSMSLELTARPLTADVLSLGMEVEIESVKEGEAQILLNERGFLPGVRMKLMAKAPGGGAMAFRIGAAVIALRPDEAAYILVTPV